MPEGCQGGERRRHAPQSVCARQVRESPHLARGRVLRLVLRPVHVDPHYAPRRKLRWWGGRIDITAGQTHGSGRNQHWGRANGRSAARRVSLSPARERAWHVRKGRRSRSPSLRGSRVRVRLPAHRCTLQKSVGDVWSRISSANALQKERAGSSERGPSAERKSAGETVGGHFERRDGASRTHR
jgi:hypothetical protein